MVEKTSAQEHDLYERIHATADFQELRRRYHGFAIPATIAFMVWYLLYALASTFARGFMAIDLIGNINVGLIFGLLQFVSTFTIAWLYSRHANKQLDPIAGRLQRRYEEEVAR